MDKYFSFNRQAAASLGVNIDENEQRFEKPLKVLTLFSVISATVQSLLFVVSATKFDIFAFNAISIGLFVIPSSFKIVSVVLNEKKLKKIKKTLGSLMSSASGNMLLEVEKDLKLYQKLTTTIAITNVVCFWMFSAGPIAKSLYIYVTEGVVVQLYPLSFWYPFDKTKLPFPVIYFYEFLCGHIFTATPLILDGMIFLMLGQLFVLFKIQGKKFVQIINEYEASDRSTTTSKINETVDRHIQLLDLAEELVSIYEIPLLVNVLTQAGTICFIGIIMALSNQTSNETVTTTLGLFNSFAQIFLVCWFGEQLKGNSSSVANEIMRSNYYDLDIETQRDLVLIINRAQAPKYLKASKFMKLKLSAFTSIVRTSFSYYTLVRQLYSNNQGNDIKE